MKIIKILFILMITEGCMPIYYPGEITYKIENTDFENETKPRVGIISKIGTDAHVK